MAAVGRISRRVELRDIRLTEVHATRHAALGGPLRLKPSYECNCVPVNVTDQGIEVVCSYTFKVRTSEADVAEAKIVYWIGYRLIGDDPTDEADIQHFAKANGAYHSWPFAREEIFSLTSRMGFPPYTLPVLSFLPRPQQKAPTVVSPTDSDTAPAKTE